MFSRKDVCSELSGTYAIGNSSTMDAKGIASMGLERSWGMSILGDIVETRVLFKISSSFSQRP